MRIASHCRIVVASSASIAFHVVTCSCHYFDLAVGVIKQFVASTNSRDAYSASVPFLANYIHLPKAVHRQ